jgi:3-deoxy-D-manno-octulosonic-acid transferase
MIINGRFHERMLARYRWFYRIIGNPLRHVDLLCMRDQDEAEHAVAIGASPERVRVTGNTKFDSCRLDEAPGEHALAELASALGLGTDIPVWLAGSTHEGEEGRLFDVFRALRKTFQDLRLVVAPRYIERAERLVALAAEHDLPCALRSTGAGEERVVILDSVGELRHAYRLATVVFVGGSFVRRGGQNILEPAACGKPVLFGPHMENFRGSVRVLLGRGGIQVPDATRLQRVLADLLARPDELDKLGRMAYEAVTSVQGATESVTRAILGKATQDGGDG